MRRKDSVPGYEEARLLAALGEEGCPVCHDIAGNDDHYFFWFFNENYYESFTLDALTRSLGFCLTHGAGLTRTAWGPQQLAAVHEVLVRRIRAMLSGRQSAHPLGETRGSALVTYARCPVCRDTEEMAGRAAFWMARLLDDPARADRYALPGMLCFLHLQAVAPRVSPLTLKRPIAHLAQDRSSRQDRQQHKATPGRPSARTSPLNTLRQ